jgi:WhiB family transcriptional regulator, redox-sensing transcriptional regulator
MSADPSSLTLLVLRRDRPELPCAGHADLFFPPDGGREKWSDKTERERQAVALCACCPAITECLDEAETRGERWGIWGGLTAGQRRARRRSVAGTTA